MRAEAHNSSAKNRRVGRSGLVQFDLSQKDHAAKVASC